LSPDQFKYNDIHIYYKSKGITWGWL
jgi:hypothetical protein